MVYYNFCYSIYTSMIQNIAEKVCSDLPLPNGTQLQQKVGHASTVLKVFFCKARKIKSSF